MPFYPIGVQAAALQSSLIPGTYIQGQQSLNTNAGLGNNNLRLTPFYSPVPFHVSAVGAEFTAAGDAAGFFSVAGYLDNGQGYPGALLTSPGSISTGTSNGGTVATGGTPGVYMVPLAASVLVPAGISWWGGAIQASPTTQPTMRTAAFSTFAAAPNAVPGVNVTSTGYLQAGVSGALPAQFQAYAGNFLASSPRAILLVSSVP